MKNINEMLNELKEKDVINVSVGIDGFCESYKGIRYNTIEIVSNTEKFNDDMSTMLLLNDNGELIEKNIEYAYKHLIAQKFALPKIL